METLKKRIAPNNVLIDSEPTIKAINKESITIVNPNLSSGIIVHAPNVVYAVWNPPIAEMAANLTILASIYLPPDSTIFNHKNLICKRLKYPSTEIEYGYKIEFSFPENKYFEYYQLYTIQICDSIDVTGTYDDNTEFQIEVILADTDPKTSRGTVTTVIKSA